MWKVENGPLSWAVFVFFKFFFRLQNYQLWKFLLGQWECPTTNKSSTFKFHYLLHLYPIRILKKSFWRTQMSFLGLLVPLFWISGDVSLGFKARVGSDVFTFCGGDVMYIPEIDLWCYMCQPLGNWLASSQVPTYCCRSEVAGIRTHALRISVSQTLYQLS